MVCIVSLLTPFLLLQTVPLEDCSAQEQLVRGQGFRRWFSFSICDNGAVHGMDIPAFVITIGVVLIVVKILIIVNVSTVYDIFICIGQSLPGEVRDRDTVVRLKAVPCIGINDDTAVDLIHVKRS